MQPVDKLWISDVQGGEREARNVPPTADFCPFFDMGLQ